jgi:ribosomal protein L29
MQTQLRATRAFAAGSKPAVRRTSVVVQAKPTKFAEFKGLSNEEVLQTIGTLKKELVRLNYMRRTQGNVINPDNGEEAPEAKPIKIHEIRYTKRQIAQLMTLLRERQIEDGLTQKESRKLKKEILVAGGMSKL